ncbi:hypothetical protein ABTM68_21015, partial [Acinetobacter baumannii]
MKKSRFLPIAGITAALAAASFVLLSLLFPHKKEEVADSSPKADAIFAAKVAEASAQPTAATAVDPMSGTSTAPSSAA